MQYRLNEGASQYIRAFYNNNTYDWLEGLIGEYGVGFKWQRKLQHFKDIFRFKTDKQQIPAAPMEKNPAVKKSTNEKKDTMEKARTKAFDPLKLNEK